MILLFATVEVYGKRPAGFDLVAPSGIGLLVVVMRRFNFPTAPVMVGMILGPQAKAQIRNAPSKGEGKWRLFAWRLLSLSRWRRSLPFCCCRV